jgi:hypothetical protein
MRWSLEPATHGVGLWLVGRGDRRVEVIAAPGTRIAAAECEPWQRTMLPLAGWRHASWDIAADRPVNLDRDSPDSDVLPIDTLEVLELVDPALHEPVRLILEDQLAQLEAMDLLPAVTQDPSFESVAHRQLTAVAWVRGELARAFSDLYPDLQNPSALVSGAGARLSAGKARLRPLSEKPDLPNNLQELEAQMSVTAYSRGLGVRELARLLKRRVIWRAFERLPRVMLVGLFVLSPSRGDLHELVIRWLTERAYHHDWPLIVDLAGIEGRRQRFRAVAWPERQWGVDSQGGTAAEVRVDAASVQASRGHFHTA